MSSECVYKRCRPQLGTFAEVVLHGGDERLQKRACEAAFAAIDMVDKAMSFHRTSSDLTLLNQAPVGAWVTLPRALLTVLQTAQRLQEATEGVFHVGVANSLSAWGLLPEKRPPAAHTSELVVPDDALPCFETRPTSARRTQDRRLDLGGIAKGYAVDAAIGALSASMGEGARGWVNIGGDLRVLGDKPPRWIMVRKPALSSTSFVSHRLTMAAMATSSVPAEAAASPFVDTRSGRPWRTACTVVAQASSCMLADAFTKIGALLDKGRALALAQRFDVALTVFS